MCVLICYYIVLLLLLQVYGRVYVAREGINAQMAVPSNIFPHFEAACRRLPLLAHVLFNTDRTVTREQFFEKKVFKSLHLIEREQVLTDGLTDATIDWCDAGAELDALEVSLQAL